VLAQIDVQSPIESRVVRGRDRDDASDFEQQHGFPAREPGAARERARPRDKETPTRPINGLRTELARRTAGPRRHHPRREYRDEQVEPAAFGNHPLNPRARAAARPIRDSADRGGARWDQRSGYVLFVVRVNADIDLWIREAELGSSIFLADQVSSAGAVVILVAIAAAEATRTVGRAPSVVVDVFVVVRTLSAVEAGTTGILRQITEVHSLVQPHCRPHVSATHEVPQATSVMGVAVAPPNRLEGWPGSARAGAGLADAQSRPRRESSE
jgi:hypothetical protein